MNLFILSENQDIIFEYAFLNWIGIRIILVLLWVNSIFHRFILGTFFV